MGAGLHNGNGLKQSVCGQLWSTYVVPHLHYGLEVLDLTRRQSARAVSKKVFEPNKSVPNKTHNSALLVLMGILPLERVIHKNMPNMLGRWIIFEGVEKNIAVWQLDTKSGLDWSPHPIPI